MKRSFAVIAGLFSFAVLSTSAYALTFFDDRAAWEAAAGAYTSTTDLPGASGTPLPGGTPVTVTAGGKTVSFGGLSTVTQIGYGWATWSGGYAGEVLVVQSDSISGSLSSGLSGFGFEAEPNVFREMTIALGLDDGSTLTQQVNGDAGAKFFGWMGGSVSSFTVSTNDNAFALGNFRAAESQVPLPGAVVLLGSGLLGLVGCKRRKC